MSATMTEPRKRGRKPKGDAAQDRTVSRHKNPRESFHLPTELRKALEDWIETQRPKPSKSACMLVGLEMFLTSKGVWPPPKPE